MTRFKVEFGQKGRARTRVEPAPVPLLRPSRAARHLALAYWVEQRIEAGQLLDLADAARLLGVTRARMTQIANMRFLPAEAQEQVLTPGFQGSERQLRKYENSGGGAIALVPSGSTVPSPRHDSDQSDPNLAASVSPT